MSIRHRVDIKPVRDIFQSDFALFTVKKHRKVRTNCITLKNKVESTWRGG